MPFSVTVYILVTSSAPLRVYMYPEGRVNYRYGPHKAFNKVIIVSHNNNNNNNNNNNTGPLFTSEGNLQGGLGSRPFSDYTNTMVWERMSARQATPWSY